MNTAVVNAMNNDQKHSSLAAVKNNCLSSKVNEDEVISVKNTSSDSSLKIAVFDFGNILLKLREMSIITNNDTSSKQKYPLVQVRLSRFTIYC